jgi:hypothetical protein
MMRLGGTAGVRRREAVRRQAPHLGDIPGSIGIARQDAKRHAFGLEFRAPTGCEAVTNGLKVGCHLARQHLDVTRAEHAQGVSLIGDGLQGHRDTRFIDRPAGRSGIVEVEGREVEALPRHEHIRHDVAPAAGKRLVVAPGARVGVGCRYPVEIAGEEQGRGGIGQGLADPCGQWTPAAFLRRPYRIEQFASVIQSKLQRQRIFLTVAQVPRHGYFLPDFRAMRTPRKGAPCNQKEQFNSDFILVHLCHLLLF